MGRPGRSIPLAWRDTLVTIDIGQLSLDIFSNPRNSSISLTVKLNIRNAYDIGHSYQRVNGIQHGAYNDAVDAKLTEFLQNRPKPITRSRMTKKDAIAFADLIKKSDDFVISTFNAGVQAEADEALRVGNELYAGKVATLGHDRATELAKEAGKLANARKRCFALNAAATSAGRTVFRRAGRWVVRGVPLWAWCICLLQHRMLWMSNEIFLDVIGPVGLARDGAMVIGAGHEDCLRIKESQWKANSRPAWAYEAQ